LPEQKYSRVNFGCGNSVSPNNTAHFPTLRTEQATDSEKSVELVQILHTNSALDFGIFKNKNKVAFSLFSAPFEVDVDPVLDEFQPEMCSAAGCEEQIVFCKFCSPGNKFPVLRTCARKTASLFGTTCLFFG
jgi:hypothetical protein